MVSTEQDCFSAGTYQLVPITYRFSFWRENQHIASEPYANEHNCELQVGIAGLRLIRGETLNIHSRLREVFYARLILYKECDGDMRKAAISEEYAVASRLKIQRDIAKDEAMSSLHEVEEEFVGNMNDLSLSTIKDESFMSQKSTRSIQHFCDSDQISVMGSPFKCNSSNHNESSIQEHNLHDFSNQSSSDNLQDDNSDVPHVHPLAGIENAEELPPPEDISKDISTDLIHKVEDLFGSYISKCLFSKVC